VGVSRRTLENWEQGRVQPSGAARRLLQLAARYPDTVKKLAHI
jgi:putative transcriptional regulator